MTPQLQVVNNMGLQDIPHSEKAEQAVIGSVLLDPTLFDQLTGIVRASDFYLTRHKVIWQAFVDVVQAGGVCDQLLVAERLRTTRKLDDIGGLSYLLQLSTSVGTSLYGEMYAQIVKRTAVRRSALEAADKIRQAACNESIPLEDVMSVIDASVKGVLTSTTANTVHEMSDLASAALDRMERAVQMRNRGEQPLAGIPYGFRDVDTYLQGAQRGQYIIVCGRPSSGKSVFAVQTALHFAMAGKRVRIFSTEMTEEEVFDRLVTMHTGIPYYAHRSGQLNMQHMQKYTNAVGYLSKLPITIDSEPKARPSYIWRESIKQHERTGLDAIIVDGTYRLATDEKHNSLYDRGNEIAMAMKNLARHLQVPLIGTHQIGRDADRRPPQLADLRESGAYEQEADVVLGMYRDEQESPTHQQTYILKQRNGVKAVLSLYFEGAQMKFYDATTSTVDFNE